MDECSGKRVHAGFVSRKGSGVVLRDNKKNRDQTAHYGNRLGYAGRLYYSNGAGIGCSDKASSKRPFCSSNGKEIVGSSSRSSPAIRKSFAEPFGKISPWVETDSSENGSIHDELLEELEFISTPGMLHRGLHVKPESLVSSDVMLMEKGSSSADPNSRLKRNLNQRCDVDSQNTPASLRSKSLGQASSAGGTGKYSLKNLARNSVSEVILSDGSLLDRNLVRRKSVAKKEISNGDNSSSTKGKKATATSSGQDCGYRHGISISDQRQARNMFNRQHGLASLGTRRFTSGCDRVRHSTRGTNDGLPSLDSSAIASWRPQSNVSISSNASSSSQFPSDSHPRHRMTYPEPESSQSLQDIGQATFSRAGVTHNFTMEGFRCHNVDGVAEVLLALDSIEQDEELTYEQTILLETSMFLNSLNIYDQHRGMRLNIDNMTYEELLDLEERMGTVSTALPEEALTECLKRTTYQSKPPEAAMSSDGDLSDIKCCICQEEYVAGDEVGRLHCEHKYHVTCIQQWLRLKNWCPICKASAASPL